MDLTVALLVSLALVILATVGGFVLRSRQTRVRHSSLSVGGATPLTPQSLLAVDEEPHIFGERATVIQFSTEFCSRCPATARVLEAETRTLDGVRHIEIDVTRRQELIEQFNVLRTPTVLLLDETGRVRSRVSGPLGAAQARELLAAV